MLRVYPDQVPILQELLQSEEMRRISGYVNSKQFQLALSRMCEILARLPGAFKEFAPELHRFYEARIDEVTKRDQELKRPFSNSVFACMCLNFGPQVVSKPHKDHLNLAYGWCSITALGNFDHKAGGHLVLPELKLAIEFPAGSTVLIPSALFTHYNLPLRPQETRRSITQFSAGGIFRWINYGFQLKRVAIAASVEVDTWWEKGEGLYDVWPVENAEQGGEEVCGTPDTEGESD